MGSCSPRCTAECVCVGDAARRSVLHWRPLHWRPRLRQTPFPPQKPGASSRHRRTVAGLVSEDHRVGAAPALGFAAPWPTRRSRRQGRHLRRQRSSLASGRAAGSRLRRCVVSRPSPQLPVFRRPVHCPPGASPRRQELCIGAWRTSTGVARRWRVSPPAVRVAAARRGGVG